MSDEVQNWLEEAHYDSSGAFTLDPQNITSRLANLLVGHPSLPWLKLLQWLSSYPDTPIQVHFNPYAVSFRAQSCQLRPEDIQSMEEFPSRPPRDSLLEQALWLLLAANPARLEVGYERPGGQEGWVLQDGQKTAQKFAQGFHCRQVRPPIRYRYSSVEVREFRERCSLCPAQWSSGEWVPGRLDFPTSPLRADTHIYTWLAQKGGFALVPLAFYAPTGVDLDGHWLLSLERLAPPGGVASYCLTSDPESVRRVALERKQLGPFRRPISAPTSLPLGFESSVETGQMEKFVQVSASGLANYLLPYRKLALSWWNRFSVRPLRASLQMLSSYGFDETELVPVRRGVKLTAVNVPGFPRVSRILAECPAHLKTDMSGLTLVDDEDFRIWLQQLREKASIFVVR